MTEKISIRFRVVIAFVIGSVFGFGTSIGLSIHSNNMVYHAINGVENKLDNQGDRAMTLNTECVKELKKCTGTLISTDRKATDAKIKCNDYDHCSQINEQLREENLRIIKFNDSLQEKLEEYEK